MVGEEACGEGAGGLDVGGVVEEEEGLEGCVGTRGADGTGLAVGDVEEEGGADDTPPEDVEAAAVEGFAGVALVAFVLFQLFDVIP